jgi:hypothetical protein
MLRNRRIEIRFKRPKSILDFGDLPKKNPAASEAWLNGKINGSIVNRSLHREGFFFPL